MKRKYIKMKTNKQKLYIYLLVVTVTIGVPSADVFKKEKSVTNNQKKRRERIPLIE